MDLAGKTVLVTGANSGVGYETAAVCACRGAAVVMACRSRARGEAAAAAIATRIRERGSVTPGSVRVMELDVSRLSSVRAFAEAFLASHSALHVLINNAGIGNYPRNGSHVTAEGWELIFATDYIGPFLLTHLLLPLLRTSAPSRVVNVSSIAGEQADPADFVVSEMPPTTDGGVMVRYSQAKLAQVMHAAELHRREGALGSGVTAYSLHPGVINTNVRPSPPPPRLLLMALAP